MSSETTVAATRTKQVELCAATTKAGDPCPHPRQRKRDSEFCWTHDPERVEERTRAARTNASSRDGASRRLKRIERELPRVQTLCLQYMEKVMAGELTPHQAKQAQNLVQATHAINRAASVELRYREHVEKTGEPPEQAGGVIEDLAAEAERLMEEVVAGEPAPAPAFTSN